MLVGKVKEPPQYYGEDLPMPYSVLAQRAIFKEIEIFGKLLETVIGDEALLTPSFPNPASHVKLVRDGFAGEAQLNFWHYTQWQNNPNGLAIRQIFDWISKLNNAEWPYLRFLPQDLMILAASENEEGETIQVLTPSSKGPDKHLFIIVSIDGREDAFWDSDEWGREDEDLSAIGAIFGAIISTQNGVYSPTRYPEERTLIFDQD